MGQCTADRRQSVFEKCFPANLCKTLKRQRRHEDGGNDFFNALYAQGGL